MSDVPGLLVSIAIRAYRRQWLAEAIGSVLAQTHRHLELLVYDDAGNLEDVVAGFGDPRIRYHRATSRLQASGRFAAAVALCRGDVIGVLDDDDRYAPMFVERLRRALDADARAGVAFCRTTWDVDGQLCAPHDHRPPGVQGDAAAAMLREGWTVSPSHMLFRRTAYESALGDQPLPEDVAPDSFVNLRIAFAGWRHVLVDAPLVTCRWHSGQLSRSGTAGLDMTVATWQQLRLPDPTLARWRDQRLAHAHLARALERLRAGDRAGSLADLHDAGVASAHALSLARRLLHAAAQLGAPGTMAVRAWLACVPRDGRRKRPPSRTRGRTLMPVHPHEDAGAALNRNR